MDAGTIAALGALATVAVGLTTLYVAHRTKQFAKATVDLGGQAERQVTEMETSRKLEWAPYLTFQPADGGDNLAGGFVHYNATVINIGRGPAINCILVRLISKERSTWCVSSMFDLGHGDKEKFTAHAQTSALPKFLEDKPGGSTWLFCEDQFGTCHVFNPPKRPLTWSNAAAEAPDWAGWYQTQIRSK
jgi:hypothetical protein